MAIALDNTPKSMSILILTPKEEFKGWLKKAAFNEKKFPAIIDKEVTASTLETHSLAFLTPSLSNEKIIEKFINQKSEDIFNALLLTWTFLLTSWPKERDAKTIGELFDFSYYPYLSKIITLNAKENGDCSLTAIKPKPKLISWLNELVKQEVIEPLELDDAGITFLRKTGSALLTPSFQTKEEQVSFMKENHKQIFEAALMLYCEQRAHWPKERHYETLLEWFDCVNYYPLVDLSS